MTACKSTSSQINGYPRRRCSREGCPRYSCLKEELWCTVPGTGVGSGVASGVSNADYMLDSYSSVWVLTNFIRGSDSVPPRIGGSRLSYQDGSIS